MSRKSSLTKPLSRFSSKIDISKETLLFKMSKKIAQLTKVIYYLNTKNEDGSIKIKSVEEAYESELSETIKDGASIINELQIKLTESKNKASQQDQILSVFAYQSYSSA